MSSMSGKIARGATWMLLFKVVDRGLGFVSTVILARLLVPADFGLVAMAMSVIALIELASAFSFDIALIQRSNPTRAHYDTTWTLNLAIGTGCAVVAGLLAWPTASFYGDPRLVAVMLILAGGWIVQSLENIGTVNFRRDMDFRREFVFLATKRLLAVIATIVIAVTYRTYWALIIGTLVGRCSGVLLSYTMQSFRPRLSLAAIRDLVTFSGWLLVNNLLGFLTGRLSHFVIGRTLGAESLGIFTVANDIAALASSEITQPINRAVLPGLARMAEQEGAVRDGLLRVTSAVAFVVIPACAGLGAVAEPLVLTLLGSKWIAAVPAVRLLAIAGVLQLLSSNNHYGYLALGRSDIPPKIGATSVLALVPLLYFLYPFGVTGVALAQLGAAAAATMLSLFIMRRLLGIRVLDVAIAIWRPCVASLAMVASVAWLERALVQFAVTPLPAVRLVLGVACGVGVYALAAGALWAAVGRPAGAERFLLERLRTIARPAA